MIEEKTLFLPHLGIKGVYELIRFYNAYDTKMEILQKEIDFYCLEGCGACCCTPSSHLEVSVFEVIPMAIYLALKGEGERILDELEACEDIEILPCIIYHKNSEDGKQGYCSLYSYRPLICRIFGGATWHSAKKNTNELLLCNLLKETRKITPELMAIIERKFPLCTDISLEARSFNQDFDQSLLPINTALKKALEYVLFRFQWFNPDDTPNPNTPPILTPSGNAA